MYTGTCRRMRVIGMRCVGCTADGYTRNDVRCTMHGRCECRPGFKSSGVRCKHCKCLQLRSLNVPLPSNRHRRSNGDCLEGKRENYHVCSLQYCVQQLCTVNYTDMNRLTVLWIAFCLTGPNSLCLDSFLCMYYFLDHCILHACVVL